jgi:alkanesulfonate monooxygenase SsuD/methylene tetrahydromethanopterin reductase-like flavin-dependent oxidoreductase (luciferase family)
MRYGFVIPTAEIPAVLDMAVELEQAGWDAVFTWEAVYATDPWVVLGAMAERTHRVRLGTLLTPPSRRRPWKLASEVATVDRISGGRAVVALGLGALDTGFAAVGEVTDRATRAAMVDESIDLLRLFWTGEPFDFGGQHYTVSWPAPTGSFTPVQRPGPPIWVVAQAGSPRSMDRALRCDGVLPFSRTGPTSFAPLDPDDVRAVRALRPDPAWDVVIEGNSVAGDAHSLDRVAALAQAGATWWVESPWDLPGGLAQARERGLQGPPRA